jgi:hypothetical protein
MVAGEGEFFELGFDLVEFGFEGVDLVDDLEAAID